MYIQTLGVVVVGSMQPKAYQDALLTSKSEDFTLLFFIISV